MSFHNAVMFPLHVSCNLYVCMLFCVPHTFLALITHDRNHFFDRYTPHSSSLILPLLLGLGGIHHWIWCRFKHLTFGNAVTLSKCFNLEYLYYIIDSTFLLLHLRNKACQIFKIWIIAFVKINHLSCQSDFKNTVVLNIQHVKLISSEMTIKC